MFTQDRTVNGLSLETTSPVVIPAVVAGTVVVVVFILSVTGVVCYR